MIYMKVLKEKVLSIDNIIVCNVYDIYESVEGKSLILGKPQKSSFLNGSAVRGGEG